MDAKQLNQQSQKLLQNHTNNIQIEDKDIVVCSKCESEFFVSGVRLAKKKIDLTNYNVGLVHERPFMFCLHCKTELDRDINNIKNKGDLVDEKEKKIQ